MTTYTVAQLASDLNRKLHTGAIEQTRGFYDAIWGGARNVKDKVYPPELKRVAFLEQALYDQVHRYALPNDFDVNKFIDLKILSQAANVPGLYQTSPRQLTRLFDSGMYASPVNATNIAIDYDSGIKYALISTPFPQTTTIIHPMSSLSENGTWNTSSNLVNLSVDKLNYISGNGSLRFDLNNSSNTGYIENFTLTPVDLSAYVQVGAIFNWVYLPTASAFTSVSLRWASSLTDYYEFTVNGPHDNTSFTDGWNLLKFPFDNMITVGTPNPAAISSIRITFQTTGVAVTGVHIDNLVARQGKVYALKYYSNCFFEDPVTHVWKNRPTSLGDIIHCEDDTYGLLVLESALEIAQEVQDSDMKIDYDKFNKELNDKYTLYITNHKSEVPVIQRYWLNPTTNMSFWSPHL